MLKAVLSNSVRKVAVSSQRSFIIKALKDVRSANMVKVMPSKACESRRYLLRQDGMGFSLHETVIYKGKSLFINYVNHVEAVFITKGSGWIEVVGDQKDLGNGTKHDLQPGTMYALNGHEKHWLGAGEGEDMTCICVFVPPCSGDEKQNEAGVFPYIGQDGVPDYEFWAKKKANNQPIAVELKTD